DVNCRVEVRASDASVCKVEIDYVNGNSRCFRRYRIEPETKNQRGHYDFVTHVVSCSWTFDPSFYCEVGFALVNSYRVFEKGRNLMSKSPAPRAPWFAHTRRTILDRRGDCGPCHSRPRAPGPVSRGRAGTCGRATRRPSCLRNL